MRRVFLRFPIVTRTLTLGTIVIEAMVPIALFSPWHTYRVRAVLIPVFMVFFFGIGNILWVGAFPGPMTFGFMVYVPPFIWDDNVLPAWRRLRARSTVVRHLCALAHVKGERLVADVSDAGLIRDLRWGEDKGGESPTHTKTKRLRPRNDNPVGALLARVASWLPRVLFFYVMFLHLDACTQKLLPKRYQFPPWVRDNTFIWMFQIHQNSWCMFDQGIRNYGGWEAINGTVSVTRHDGSIARMRTDVDVALSLAAGKLVPIAQKPYTNDDVLTHAAIYGRSHRWMYLWVGMQKTPNWNLPMGLWLCRQWENTFRNNRLETFSVEHVQSSVENIDGRGMCNYSFNSYDWFSFSCETKTFLPKEEEKQEEEGKNDPRIQDHTGSGRYML